MKAGRGPLLSGRPGIVVAPGPSFVFLQNQSGDAEEKSDGEAGSPVKNEDPIALPHHSLASIMIPIAIASKAKVMIPLRAPGAGASF